MLLESHSSPFFPHFSGVLLLKTNMPIFMEQFCRCGGWERERWGMGEAVSHLCHCMSCLC